MEEREISIKELIHVIWNGKFMIIILAAAFLFIGFVGAFVVNRSSSQVSTIISLEWQGVTEGEYPDGTRFDYNSAVEAYVVTTAMEEQGITNLTTNQVRSAFKFVPITSSSDAAAVQKAIENGEKSAYHPTDFKIVMDNGALNLTVDESRDFLIEIIDQFRIDFERRYIQTSVIHNFISTDFSKYDYVDIYAILETQVDLIESIMNNKILIDPGFVSPTLGIGFADIVVRTDLVDRLELEQISSRSKTYLLTKDVEYLLTHYAYQKEVKQIELDKALVNVVNAQNLVDNYSGSVNTIIVPGMDYDFKIDTYYSTLVNNLVELQKQISELEIDINHIDLQVSKLNGLDPNFNFTPEKIGEEITKVEVLILSAKTELNNIIQDSNTILTEYDTYTTSNVIKPLMTPQHESSVNVLMYAGIGLILGAGIGAVVVLFKHDWE